MPRAVIGFFVLAILAMAFVGATQAALENAGDDRLVVNETWTPSAGSVTQLDESERTGAYYARNVTVYDENGTEMDHGTDYDWIQDNGTVRTIAGGDLDGDADATITYAFQQTTSEQRQLAGMLAAFPRVVGLALPVGGVLFFFYLLRQ